MAFIAKFSTKNLIIELGLNENLKGIGHPKEMHKFYKENLD